MGNRTTGGCICGAVRFEVDGEPLFSSNCHCRDCQRASGSGYMPLMGFPKDAIRITGEVRYFERKAATGTSETEGFCPVCGARLFAYAQAYEGIFLVRAGSLDDPSVYRPQADIYTSSAQPWDHMDPNLPKFPKMPPIERS
jgi:hypothetical protein